MLFSFVSFVSYAILLCLSNTATTQSPSPTPSCFTTRPVPIDRWRGEYFNNRDLNGPPAMVRDEGVREIDFDWGLGSPSKDCGLNVDEFSVRFTRTVAFAAGDYRFTITSDDGVRLFIDGQEKFSSWQNRPLTTNTIDVTMTAGNHKIVLEYFENFGSALVRLSWKEHPCISTVSADHWRGDYFNNDSLSGQPVMVRDDGDSFRGIEINWADSPSLACGVRQDGFSVRWTGTPSFDRGLHRFNLSAFGGVKLLIDGQVKIDQWISKSQKHAFDLELEAGLHQIVLEYADFGGKASVKLTWQPPPCINTVSTANWRGEYFKNKNLSGRPSIIRDEGTRMIEFDWGLGSPHRDCLEITDGFSARWSRNVNFAKGTYRFTVTGDDGIRLFVDGRKLIDEWRDQSAKNYNVDIELTGGPHRIVLEYFENVGSSSVKLSWTAAPCTTVVLSDRWKGEYFNNTDLSGSPALVRDEGNEQLNFDWGLKGPDSNCGINVDNYSARWTRTVTFGEGIFRFAVTADDGVRIYIDRQLKFERWVDQMATHTFDVPLSAGNHELIVEYFERGGSAALKLTWEQHPCIMTVPPKHWRGEYFNNASLSGRPAMVRDEGEGYLDFDWGSQSPAAGCNVNADDFSVRWSRKVILGAGLYRFVVTGDDGVRLFIDGKNVIDQWRNQKRSTFETTIYLAPGNHRLVLEYYDHTGEAAVNLAWR